MHKILAIVIAGVASVVTGLIAFAALPVIPAAPYQQAQDETTEEIVANIAAGRVIVAVFKDAIAIGTIENEIENPTELPLIVPLSSERVGVLLGAVNWFSPSTRTAIADLPPELPHLRYRGSNVAPGPHLVQSPANDAAATDIEQTGLGVMMRLSEVSSNIHGHVDVKPDEPLTELVIADYLEAYGPEVWFMTYEIEQQPERGDFWVTRVKRPKYNQVWPPEKTAPHTLVELDYPPANAKRSLRELLAANAGELAGLRSSSAMSASCDALLSNSLSHETSDSGLPCMRNAMDALAKGNKEELAVITPEGSLRWIIAPPAETRPKSKEPHDENAPTLQRPPNAPSLRKN